MKFCLSSTLDPEYLREAAEIKVSFENRTQIPDLLIDYPQADIIFTVPFGISAKEIAPIIQNNESRFILCLHDLTFAPAAKDLNVRFFYGYPANSYESVRIAQSIDAEYVKINGPLFFDLHRLSQIPIKKRVTANVAGLYELAPQFDLDICTSYMRPEDVDFYSQYIDTIEFEMCNKSQEQALFRIYSKEKSWQGKLRLLITNLNNNADNNLIPPTFAECRANCRQACLTQLDSCKVCPRILALADAQFLQQIKN